MNQELVLPVLLQVLLPLLVTIKMFKDRTDEMKAKRIHPQSIALRSQSQEKLTNSKASDNLKNLFEMPVLFFALIFLFIASEKQSQVVTILTWGYVLTRYWHSFVHCTYNKVMHRFYAFGSSMLILTLLFMAVAKQLLGF